MRFQIDNMTCGHCVRTITRAIQAIAPSATVQIDLARGTADIDGPLTAAQIVEAIDAAGYAATPLGDAALP